MITRTSRLDTLLSLLACPACHGPLTPKGQMLRCTECASGYPVHLGRPVFLPGRAAEPRVMPAEHISNQPPTDILDWLMWQPGWVLNLGAGGTRTKLEHCVELEYTIFRNTDVVADAHHLPFADEAFDAVVTFNTFEHLSDPNRAAAEIRRVLKPGGRLVLHTAFLQPLHEAPHHYYNTTEFGLRQWFREFDVESVSVSENFNPAHVIAWLACEMLQAVEAAHGPEARRRLAASSLDCWASSWTDTGRRQSPLWDLLGKLPQEVQKRFAAGFQLTAVKPEGEYPVAVAEPPV